MIQTHSKAKQGGFTLVEIAIVLVIIGLLLGGILKGQELITSARVRNMADQNSSVQAAYYGFLDRYRAIPGDIPPGAGPGQSCTILGNFQNCLTTGGNGDGIITGGSFPEAAAVWAHLAAAGFLNGNYIGGAGAPYTAPNTAPGNVYGGPILLAHTANYTSLGGAPATQRLNLIMGINVPVKVYQELDTKLDDALPLTGVLRAAVLTGGGALFGAVAEDPSGCPTGANTWNIGVDAQNCNGVYLY